jgi:hypothetical protein
MTKERRTEQRRQRELKRIGEILEAFKQHPECKTTEELFAVMGWKFAEWPSPRPRVEEEPR